MIVYDHMKHESWKQLNSLADWFNLIIFCKQYMNNFAEMKNA